MEFKRLYSCFLLSCITRDIECKREVKSSTYENNDYDSEETTFSSKNNEKNKNSVNVEAADSQKNQPVIVNIHNNTNVNSTNNNANNNTNKSDQNNDKNEKNNSDLIEDRLKILPRISYNGEKYILIGNREEVNYRLIYTLYPVKNKEQTTYTYSQDTYNNQYNYGNSQIQNTYGKAVPHTTLVDLNKEKREVFIKNISQSLKLYVHQGPWDLNKFDKQISIIRKDLNGTFYILCGWIGSFITITISSIWLDNKINKINKNTYKNIWLAEDTPNMIWICLGLNTLSSILLANIYPNRSLYEGVFSSIIYYGIGSIGFLSLLFTKEIILINSPEEVTIKASKIISAVATIINLLAMSLAHNNMLNAPIIWREKVQMIKNFDIIQNDNKNIYLEESQIYTLIEKTI